MPIMSERLGLDVLVKREDLQSVFSFKLRGAYAKLRSMTEAERARGVICASAGNHAQGVAMAARHLVITSYSIHYTKLYEVSSTLIVRDSVVAKNSQDLRLTS